MAARIDWPKDYPTKQGLMQGIEVWVHRRAKRPDAPSFTYLHQLTLDDLILLAMAMGYKPAASARTRIANLDAQHHVEVKRRTVEWDAWKVREAARKLLEGPIPMPDQSQGEGA